MRSNTALMNNKQYVVFEAISESLITIRETPTDWHIFQIDDEISDLDFSDWCDRVDSLDLSVGEHTNNLQSLIKRHFELNTYRGLAKQLIKEFLDAIKDYLEQQKKNIHLSKISNESVKYFLFLFPVISALRPKIYVDSNNGCLNMDLTTRDSGVLSSQVSDNGNIHYSLVSKNKKIYKITGIAKFRDKKDLVKFSKVLRML